jgi:putative ABC transport system permease protein
VKRTDGEFWQIMQFNFLEGRPLTTADDEERQPVAVINEATRRRFFGDGVQAAGQSIQLDGQSFRVVGVVADVPAYRRVPYADVWIPTGATRSQDFRRHLIGDFQAVILAHDRRDFPLIKEEFTSRLGHVEFPEPDRYNTMQGSLTTHAEEAFGASPPVLVGQFVIENVLLCLVGGAIGFALSWIVLAAMGMSGLIAHAHFAPNYRIFGWALLLATLFGVLSGVYPAWRMSRMNPVLALKGASR